MGKYSYGEKGPEEEGGQSIDSLFSGRARVEYAAAPYVVTSTRADAAGEP